MSNWEDLVCKTKELASAAGRKATDMADVAKQKLKMAENDKAMDETLKAMGQLLYESRRSHQEINEEVMTELVSQVSELIAANEELQATIDNLSGKKTCESCGAVNPENAAYCNNCGKPIK